jgi:ABC-type amino acid transport substrate-binding protein
MIRPLLLSLMFLLVATSAMAAGLKVGVSADYPPMAFMEQGHIVGIEADNAKALSGIVGQELTLVNMPFNKLIRALQAGEIDVIMSALSVTPEREQQVLFTDAFMEVGQMAIIRTEKAAQFAQPRAVFNDGVRVGVEPGTTGAQFVERDMPKAQVKSFTDSAAAFAALRGDEIDVYIHDAPTSWELARSMQYNDLISLYKPLTHEQLAWAVRKDDERLAAMLNDALKTMKGNGTLRYILNRWIPVTVEVR